MASPSTVVPSDSLAVQEAAWRQMRDEYDRFCADHINEIIAARADCMAEIAAKRVALDQQLRNIASFRIASNHQAACILRLLFDVSGAPTDSAQHIAGRNILRYLQGYPPYEG